MVRVRRPDSTHYIYMYRGSELTTIAHARLHLPNCCTLNRTHFTCHRPFSNHTTGLCPIVGKGSLVSDSARLEKGLYLGWQDNESKIPNKMSADGVHPLASAVDLECHLTGGTEETNSGNGGIGEASRRGGRVGGRGGGETESPQIATPSCHLAWEEDLEMLSCFRDKKVCYI